MKREGRPQGREGRDIGAGDLYQLATSPQPFLDGHDVAVPGPEEEVRGRLDAERFAADLQAQMGQLLLPLVYRHQGRTLAEVAAAQGGIAISTAHARVQEGQRRSRSYTRRRKVGPDSFRRALDLLSANGMARSTPA